MILALAQSISGNYNIRHSKNAIVVNEAAQLRSSPDQDGIGVSMIQPGIKVHILEMKTPWLRVITPDGTQGWMAARLLSRTRTAIVTGDVRAMRTSANVDAPIAYRAEPGVVGRITNCKDGWCLFDVKGRKGWIEADHIWGD